jgi:hypothetical protein
MQGWYLGSISSNSLVFNYILNYKSFNKTWTQVSFMINLPTLFVRLIIFYDNKQNSFAKKVSKNISYRTTHPE